MNDGGPAFPFWRSWENERKGYIEYEGSDGMTLRDYFAGQALAGICASVPGNHHVPANAAREAYEFADAMLRARQAK